VLGNIEGRLKFETALTAQVYLHIVTCTMPLSKYLQTVQLDLLTVHRMVCQLVDSLICRRNGTISKFVMIQLQSLFTGLNDQPDQLSKTDVGLVVEESSYKTA